MRETDTFSWASNEYYAFSFDERRVLKNINELFRDPEKDRLLRLYYGDEKYIHEQISDFEYFSHFCRLMPRLEGTLTCELAMEELYILCGFSDDPSRLADEELFLSLWRKGNDCLVSCEGDYERFLEKNAVKKCHTATSRRVGFHRVEKYNIEKGAENGSSDNVWRVDLRGLSFVRPDPYHARLCEEKLGRAETLTCDEEALLCAELVYLACAEENAVLHLSTDGDGKTAGALIDYLRQRGLGARILLAADDTLAVETVVGLCGASGDGVSVFPELVLGATDSKQNLYARLCRLSALYPLSRLSFGGSRTASPLFFAAHRHAARVYARLLSEIREW